MAEWMFFGVLAGFSVYDLKWKKINVIAIAVFAAVTLVYRICAGTEILELLLGLVPGICVSVAAVVTKESIGMGDGLVVCVLGIFGGLKPALAVLGMALLLSAMLAMILLVSKKAGKKTELPFLPCLSAGYLLYLLW